MSGKEARVKTSLPWGAIKGETDWDESAKNGCPILSVAQILSLVLDLRRSGRKLSKGNQGKANAVAASTVSIQQVPEELAI
jgi:hypothetical protein